MRNHIKTVGAAMILGGLLGVWKALGIIFEPLNEVTKDGLSIWVGIMLLLMLELTKPKEARK